MSGTRSGRSTPRGCSCCCHPGPRPTGAWTAPAEPEAEAAPAPADPLFQALARHGHAAFRPGQRAAELLEGPVLVVSPLVALIADQVDGLGRAGLAAARLDGARSSARRRRVLEYFGAPRRRPVRQLRQRSLRAAGGRASRRPPPWLAPGREVDHPELGRGVVRGADGGDVLVAFDDHGLRTLSLELVVDGGLLAPAPGSR